MVHNISINRAAYLINLYLVVNQLLEYSVFMDSTLCFYASVFEFHLVSLYFCNYIKWNL